MTTQTLLSLIPWLLPPIVGAAIGYITNAIAIKMLFRPLTEKRILGIRIPFTPGIIPRQRYKLAESIGRMVSEQLITKDAVKKQLGSLQFQQTLEKTVADATGTLLDTPLSALKQSTVPVIGGRFEEFIVGTLRTFLSSDSFYTIANKLLTHLFSGLAEKQLTALVNELNLERYLSEKLHSFLAGDDARDRLIKRVQTWLGTLTGQKKTLAAVIPEELVEIITRLFQSALPSLSGSLIAWLRRAHIRRELETRGKRLVSNILEKLNIFQRFIVSVAQYDVTIQEKMPEIVEEVLKYFEELLNDEQQQAQVVTVVKKAILNWRKKEIGSLFKQSPEELSAKAGSLVKKIWEYLRKQDAEKKLYGRIKDFLEKNGSLTLGELTGDYLGLTPEKIVDFFLRIIERREFAGNTAEKIGSLLFGFADDKPDVTLGEFVGIDNTRRKEIDEYLVNTINSMLQAKVPEMIQGLNIRELVENKINELDVADVEGLLLMVIARQLKWINVFGALLGAIIGFSQMITRLVG